MVFHHSASSPDTPFDEIRSTHLSKGWKDVGYHFVITGDGIIHPGRRIETIGAHAQGANEDSIGVCLTGDNTRHPSEGFGWRPAQIAAAQRILDAIRLLWPQVTFVGHRDTKATLCPGLDIHEVLT